MAGAGLAGTGLRRRITTPAASDLLPPLHEAFFCAITHGRCRPCRHRALQEQTKWVVVL